MAAGLMGLSTDGAVTALSAGSVPDSPVNIVSVQAMRELGIDITGQFPTPVTSDLAALADLVVVFGRDVSVAARGTAPVVSWETDEPFERAVSGMRRMRLIRDDVARRVDMLATQMERQAVFGPSGNWGRRTP